MPKKEIEFLKEKSRKFYLNEIYLFKNCDYDLSAFSLEQSCQLLLKYLIVKKVGDCPKTQFFKIY